MISFKGLTALLLLMAALLELFSAELSFLYWLLYFLAEVAPAPPLAPPTSVLPDPVAPSLPPLG